MALAGSIFGLVEGDPDQQQENQLGGLSNYQTGVGEGLTTAGAGEEEDILSGDPTKIAQAEAPEITAQQGQIQGQELQNANFGNRSGGTNASTQNAQGAGRGNIIDLTGGLINSTAGAAVGQGSNLMGQASSNINSEASMKRQQEQAEQADVAGIGTGVAQIASGLAGGGAPSASGAETPEGVGLEQMGASGGPLETSGDTDTDLLSQESMPDYSF
jgi:hypothetical protein